MKVEEVELSAQSALAILLEPATSQGMVTCIALDGLTDTSTATYLAPSVVTRAISFSEEVRMCGYSFWNNAAIVASSFALNALLVAMVACLCIGLSRGDADVRLLAPEDLRSDVDVT